MPRGQPVGRRVLSCILALLLALPLGALPAFALSPPTPRPAQVMEHTAHHGAPADDGRQDPRRGSSGPACCFASACPALPAPPAAPPGCEPPHVAAYRPWPQPAVLSDGVAPAPPLPPPRAQG